MLERGLVYDRLLVESQADGFSETHGLNLYGFRGRDFAIHPSPGQRRVLLLGDSVTEGMGAGGFRHDRPRTRAAAGQRR